MDAFEFNPFFSPIFSLILGLMILILSFATFKKNPSHMSNAIICLIFSGLFYSFGYLYVGVASDFRYQFWGMISIFIASVIYVSEQRSNFFPLTRIDWICVSVLASAFVLILTIHLLEGDALFPARLPSMLMRIPPSSDK